MLGVFKKVHVSWCPLKVCMTFYWTTDIKASNENDKRKKVQTKGKPRQSLFLFIEFNITMKSFSKKAIGKNLKEYI